MEDRRIRERIRQVEAVHTTTSLNLVAHSAMLGDRIRLDCFRRAIAEDVSDGMVVVEIGTGLGILASYIASRTRGRVIAIEVDEAAARLAESMFRAAGLDHVEVHRGLSLGRPVDAAPDVLVAELFGPLGLEESLIEIVHEFVRKYPSVTRIVPRDLTILARPVRSRTLQDHCGAILGGILGASHGEFDYRQIGDLLEAELNVSPFPCHAPDAELAGEPIPLAEFTVGRDRGSAFAADLELPEGCDAPFLNLYFSSRLSDSVKLTTACDATPTHWTPHFVSRPGNCRAARVAYDPARRRMMVRWRPG